jgi:hypothetical protein
MTDAARTNSDLVRALIGAVDNDNHNVLAALTAPDVHSGSATPPPPTPSRSFSRRPDPFKKAVADLRHTVLDLWEVDDGTVIATMDVSYCRLDGQELNLPCCNIFRVHGRLVDEYLIYMDINPVLTS